jgi:hypothetical protein
MPVAGKTDVVIDKTTLGTTGFVTITCGDATHTSIIIQDLYDAVREWEPLVENLDVAVLVVGSGKEGLGGGDLRPPTMTWQAHVQVNAAAGAGPTVRIFTFSGGTTLSDEESAGAADPRSPLKPEAFVEYDRTKGQEGLLLNVVDIETVRKIIDPSKHTLADGTTGNEIIYDDDGVTPFRTYDVEDEEGNAVALNPGDPAEKTRQ